MKYLSAGIFLFCVILLALTYQTLSTPPSPSVSTISPVYSAKPVFSTAPTPTFQPLKILQSARVESLPGERNTITEWKEPVPARRSKLTGISLPQPTVIAQDWIEGGTGYIYYVDAFSRDVGRALKIRNVEGHAWEPGKYKLADLQKSIETSLREAGYSVRTKEFDAPFTEGISYWGLELFDGFEARKNGKTIVGCWGERNFHILFWGERVPQTRQRVLDDELIQAVESNEVARVKQLLARGANPNARDLDDTFVLAFATARGHTEVVRRLLAAGAKFSDNSIYPALTEAIENGHHGVVRVLLQHGVTASYGGNSYLFTAAASGQEEIVWLLLSTGADANAKTSSGETPLMYAVDAYQPRSEPVQYPEVVRVLLDYGANVNAQNKNGETALMKAVGSINETGSHESSQTILIERGADVNLRNKQGETALSMEKKLADSIKAFRRATAKP